MRKDLRGPSGRADLYRVLPDNAGNLGLEPDEPRGAQRPDRGAAVTEFASTQSQQRAPEPFTRFF